MCRNCLRYRYDLATLVDTLEFINIEKRLETQREKLIYTKAIRRTRQTLDRELPEIFKRNLKKKQA